MLRIRDEQMAKLARHTKSRNLTADLISRGYDVTAAAETREILVKDSKGGATRLRLDDFGLLQQCTTPLGAEYRFEHNVNHQLSDLTNPNGLHVIYAYDSHGRLSRLSRGPNQLWSFDWDEWNNLSQITFPNKTLAQRVHQGPDKLARYTNRNGNTVAIHRNMSGSIVEVVDPRGNGTAYDYHKWDRPSRINYADGSYEEIDRDSMGRLAMSRINGELWAHVTYNDADKISAIRYADGHFVAFTYDFLGNIIEARNPSVVVRRQYDQQNRLIREDQGGEVVDYSYDSLGLLTAVKTPTGESLRFYYDADGRLARVEDWNGGQHNFIFAESGRTVQHQYPNGVSTSTDLDNTGLASEITTRLPQSSRQTLSLRFKYSVNDQIVSLYDSELGFKTFCYDPEGGLVSVESIFERGNETFAYDANGNRTRANTETAEFDLLNRMERHGQTLLTYDSRGNLIRESTPDGTTQYAYNGQNLLTTVVLPNGVHIEFAYDAFARRIFKSVRNITTRYVWSGDQLLCEITEEGSHRERRDYLFMPYTFTPLSMRLDGTVYQYHTDHKGTPRWLTNAVGQVMWSAEHTAFGRTFIIKDTVKQSLRFAGQYFDEETHLHYHRTRYYSPVFGRYLSQDPLGLASGINLYIYVGNDPVNETDPLGLWSWKTALAAAAVVAGAALIIVAAPVVAAAVVAVATGAAVAAGTATAAAMVVGGATLVGAGIGLGMTSDSASITQQAIHALKGGAIGAGAALAVMGAAFTAAGVVAGCGTASGGLTLAGAGGGGGGAVSGAGSQAVAVGMSAAAAGTMMMQGGGGSGWDGDNGRSRRGEGRRGGGGRRQSGKKDDIKQIDDIAKKHKMDSDTRRDFGDFVEEQKAMGRRGTKNERGDFTWDELDDLAREFLE